MRDGIGARVALGTLGVCAAMTVASVASADDASTDLSGTFGAPGTVVMSGNLRAGYSKSDIGGAQQVTTNVGATAFADVFVARRFSLGLGAGFGRAKASATVGGEDGGGYRSFTVGAAARLGYYVPVGDRVGFWPMVSAGTMHIDIRQNGYEYADGHIDELKLLANIVFHVDRGWFLTVTPGLVAYSKTNLPIGLYGVGSPDLAVGFGGYF